MHCSFNSLLCPSSFYAYLLRSKKNCLLSVVRHLKKCVPLLVHMYWVLKRVRPLGLALALGTFTSVSNLMHTFFPLPILAIRGEKISPPPHVYQLAYCVSYFTFIFLSNFLTRFNLLTLPFTFNLAMYIATLFHLISYGFFFITRLTELTHLT